ncbi:heat shock gene repressor HrcA [Halobacteroides halobius DSM 5150]|uniref:Heat-inducible transcription repressor HrcA n=1 Tax=Halobacteroides halobius (strain ATCC 35273 / DSM 5150 / MD-1) TaxID=748449 RepID=L0K9Z0_HALHC|nr:heat-inducible transcriptional repressor HrcA [Halobacteroides halobius]AGB41811.1 heat shock gene repressor HrcA [Halobacteroides halobius DSM 5150]
MEITDRKKRILKAIIKEYIMTAEPVGSRKLTRRYNFDVSSATIRNEMADLEEFGYLEQPHRSAGRIPSDKGYRFYVDTLMDSNKLSSTKVESIWKEYNSKHKEIQGLIEDASQLLSDLTKYTSLASSPRIQESSFEYLKLVPVTNRKILLVLVTDTGIVKDKLVEVPSSFNQNKLEDISRFLNQRLHGLPLYEIDDGLLTRLSQDLVNRLNLDLGELDFLSPTAFKNNFSSAGKIYLEGTTYILDQPEFSDIDKIKNVLQVLEHEAVLKEILGNSKGDLQISIGSENKCKEIKDCSIVIATYHFGNRPIGKIGVLGPTRMNYSEVVGTVKFMSKLLSNYLTNKVE